MPVAENKIRNREIVRKYKPGVVGYKKLAGIYNVDWTVIRDIVKRYEKKRIEKTVGV